VPSGYGVGITWRIVITQLTPKDTWYVAREGTHKFAILVNPLDPRPTPSEAMRLVHEAIKSNKVVSSMGPLTRSPLLLGSKGSGIRAEPMLKPHYPIEVYLYDRKTGERAVYNTEGWDNHDDEEFGEFIWSEGNYACDCNRSMFFADARGYDRNDKNSPYYSDCNIDTRFVIEKIIRVSDQKIVYMEKIPEAQPWRSNEDSKDNR
jgi:hypothetical protein